MAIVERKLSNFKGETRPRNFYSLCIHKIPLTNQLKTQQERDTRWKRMQSWIRSMKIRFVFEENNYTGWRANYYSISRYWSIIELVWIVYFVKRYFPEVVDNRYIISISYRFKIIIQNLKQHILIKLLYITCTTCYANIIICRHALDMLNKKRKKEIHQTRCFFKFGWIPQM